MSVVGKMCAAAAILGGLALGAAPAGADTGIALQPEQPATSVDGGIGVPSTGSGLIDTGVSFLCAFTGSAVGSASGSAGGSGSSIPGCF